MLKGWLTVLGVALLSVLVPAGALGKGASEATITGPGLDAPLALPGEGQPGGERLMQIAEQAGFFAAVFGQTPDPMLEKRPAGGLGPKYSITYVMPGPNEELDTIAQVVYPFAKPAPVTYTRPGQRFWTTERTQGGWFQATSTLRENLVAAGLPTTPPAPARDDGFHWLAAGVTALVVALVIAVLGGLARTNDAPRRQLRSAERERVAPTRSLSLRGRGHRRSSSNGSARAPGAAGSLPDARGRVAERR